MSGFQVSALILCVSASLRLEGLDDLQPSNHRVLLTAETQRHRDTETDTEKTAEG